MLGPRLGRCLLALAMLTALACGDDDSDDSADTTSTTTNSTTSSTTTEATTTTAEPTDEELIEAVVQRHSRLGVEVDGAEDPAIAELTTGAAREVLEGNLRTEASNAQTRQGNIVFETTEVTVVDDIAEVRGCVLDGIEIVDAEGTVVVGANPVPYVVRLELEREGGLWKVSNLSTRNNEGEQTPCEFDA